MESNKNGEEKIQQETRGTENSFSKEEKSSARELTQTDHLNRRLLGAFLTRLNSGSTDLPCTNTHTSTMFQGTETEDDAENGENYSDNQNVK